MSSASCRPSMVALLAIAFATLASAAPALAQDDAGTSMCVLTLDEVSGAVGLPFVSTDEARGTCSYLGDPTVDMYAIDVRIDPEGSLDSVRFAYDSGGQDTTVAGLPAWSSDDGLFVDVGGRLLVVQPVFFLADAAPDPVAVQGAIAELAAPRVGAAIDAAFGAEDRLSASFPTEIAGQPIYPDIMNGADLLRYVDLGTAAIEEVLASDGLGLDDVLIAYTSTGEETEIYALQVPGFDASLLVPAVSGRLAGPDAKGTLGIRSGRAVLAFPDARAWLHVDGEILWVINRADEPTVDAILEALP